MKTSDKFSNTQTICYNKITGKHEIHYFPEWIYEGFNLGINNQLIVKKVFKHVL